MKADVNRRPGRATFSGVRLAPSLGADGAQLGRLQRGVRIQQAERLVRCTDACIRQSPCASPLGPRTVRSSKRPKRRRPPRGAHDNARRQLSQRDSAEPPRRPAKGFSAGSAARRSSKRSLLQQSVKGGGERRAQFAATRRNAGATPRPPPDAPRGRFCGLHRARCRSVRQVRRHRRTWDACEAPPISVSPAPLAPRPVYS